MDKNRYILAVNVGSSSLKAGLYDSASAQFIARCQIAGIGGTATGRYSLEREQRTEEDAQFADHGQAFEKAAELLVDEPGTVVAVGHRVVFSGVLDKQTAEIDDAYLEELRLLSNLDSGHLPAMLTVIEAARSAFASVPHFACSDSAFFATLPERVKILPLPRRYYEQGVKKYGYHGLSYAYLSREFAKRHPEAAGGKVVYAHLGNGASLAALAGGRPIDTTMAFSPNSGILMSSRSGDLDPGAIAFLERRENLGPEAMDELLTNQSGLKGISGTTGDMQTLLENETADPAAADAVGVFCLAVQKAVGAMSAAMGGIDALVFSGGIGEESARVRQLICTQLGHLNISLEEEKNQQGLEVISKNDSILVSVLKSDEELIIAREVKDRL